MDPEKKTREVEMGTLDAILSDDPDGGIPKGGDRESLVTKDTPKQRICGREVDLWRVVPWAACSVIFFIVMATVVWAAKGFGADPEYTDGVQAFAYPQSMTLCHELKRGNHEFLVCPESQVILSPDFDLRLGESNGTDALLLLAVPSRTGNAVYRESDARIIPGVARLFSWARRMLTDHTEWTSGQRRAIPFDRAALEISGGSRFVDIAALNHTILAQYEQIPLSPYAPWKGRVCLGAFHCVSIPELHEFTAAISSASDYRSLIIAMGMIPAVAPKHNEFKNTSEAVLTAAGVVFAKHGLVLSPDSTAGTVDTEKMDPRDPFVVCQMPSVVDTPPLAYFRVRAPCLIHEFPSSSPVHHITIPGTHFTVPVLMKDDGAEAHIVTRLYPNVVTYLHYLLLGQTQ